MKLASDIPAEQKLHTAAGMHYRRFGRTEQYTSVFTLGGMRYKHGWTKPHNEVPDETLEQAWNVTRRALEVGINHLETARAYVKSETIYGLLWPKIREWGLEREELLLTTKVRPTDAETTFKQITESLTALQTDYIDILDIHGINNEADMEKTFGRGGSLEGLRRAQKEGLIRHIGFSTHGPPPLILDVLGRREFDAINLHYYYFYQANHAAVTLAGQLDMGVFIISPNDKGGQLFKPSRKLRELCSPMEPMNFNDRFLLGNPHVHTLSLGASEPAQIDTHLPSLTSGPYWDMDWRAARHRLDGAFASLESLCTVCGECLPCPEKINIPETLRLFNMYQAADMSRFGRYRYNMMQPDDAWIAGARGSSCTNCGDCLPRCPQQLAIPDLVMQADEKLYIARKPAG
jgi:predicted aldo/keto reductase-like oxidoreductase